MNPTENEIKELLAFLPQLKDKNFSPIKCWKGGKQADGTTQLGYPEYNEITLKFIDAISQPCWSYPYDPVVAGQMIDNASAISTATMDQIKEMLTFCARGERFCEGHWGEVIENGTIESLLERLSQLAQTT